MDTITLGINNNIAQKNIPVSRATVMPSSLSIHQKPFSKLPKATSLLNADLLCIVQNGTNYKLTASQIPALVANNRKIINVSQFISLEDLLINEIVISPVDESAINIKCLAFSKEEFQDKFGADATSKIVKISLETTIIKSIPKLTTASSVATHSLVNSFSSTTRNGITIFCDESSSPTTRNFAGCFADEYMEWASDRGETDPIQSEFLNTVQLVFEGEYLEIEWRDWDNDGMFRPWVRPPLWYKQPHINSGGILKFGNYINNRSKAIASSIFSQDHTLSATMTTGGIDLGDILEENHCLKYRLGMTIPKQTKPNCLPSGGTRSDFRQDSLLLEAPSSLSQVTKISSTMYASELCPLMYDKTSNTYMPIHMSNRSIKGYSEIKTKYAGELRNMAEHNAVLRHEHGATNAIAFPSLTYISSLYTSSVDNANQINVVGGGNTSNFTSLNDKTEITTTIGGPTKSRMTTENRVDSIYQQMYLFF